MGKWNRLMNLWVGAREEISQGSYIHVCITCGHRQKVGEGLGWAGIWMERSNGCIKGKNIYNTVNNKGIKKPHAQNKPKPLNT